MIGELIETACLLAKSEQKEITISSIYLLKMLVTIFSQSTLATYLKPICDIVHNLHEKRSSKTNGNDEINSFNNMAPISKSQQIRSLVKIILKKLIKKFTFEIVYESVFENEKKVKKTGDMVTDEIGPGEVKRGMTNIIKQGLENLFVNLKKTIEVEKKRKAEETKKSNKPSANADLVSMYTTKTSATKYNNEIEDLLKESDDDEPAEEDVKSQRTNKKDRSSKRSEKKSQNNGHKSWIQENDNEDPLDLLDPMAIKNVFATKPLTKQQILMKKTKEEASRSKNRGFTMSSDGKLLIGESDDENLPDDRRSKAGKSKGNDYLDDMMDTLSLDKKSMASRKSKKQTMDEDDSDDDGIDDKKSRFSYKAGGTGIHRQLNGKREVSQYGSEYKAKVSYLSISNTKKNL